MPNIIELGNGEIVNPAEIFGKDARRLMAACYPDQWTIYKKNEPIARICCM